MYWSAFRCVSADDVTDKAMGNTEHGVLKSNTNTKQQAHVICCSCKWTIVFFIIPPNNEVVGGYIGFTPSVCPSVRPSVPPAVSAL